MGSVSPFSQHPPSLVGRLSWRILPFQNVEGPREKTEGEPVSEWTARVTGHCAYALSSADQGPHGGAETAVDHTNERWDFTEGYLMGVGS